MGLQIPAALEPVAAVVVYRWPKADETKLFSLGNKAEMMANTLEKYSGKIDTKFREALGYIEGETHDAIERYRQQTMHAIETLTDLLRDIALALRIYASLILAIKLYIISMLIYTAIQLAAAAAAAVPTLGASTAEAAAMQVAIRTAITQALQADPADPHPDRHQGRHRRIDQRRNGIIALPRRRIRPALSLRARSGGSSGRGSRAVVRRWAVRRCCREPG
ncbi:WXG100-like domain-containing protein [Nocardia anaemiae]|uniref:WXG100-like domain-containing protein n=1 Tax=Nocardia anaemiae TaxID=263910 RepID=UPI0007A4FD9C|nr:hypothetical protein [Nocardia anaemiae]